MMKASKPYPKIDEEDGSCLRAQEPVADTASVSMATRVVIPPSGVPGLPQTWEELQKCIEEGEREYENGEAIPWETAVHRMRAHVRGYVA